LEITNFFTSNSRQILVGNLLEKFNLYYRELSPKAKHKFVRRLLKIEKELIVIGKGIDITDDMRQILLSYIVQLTFGFKKYFLTGYEYIYVYPSSFSLKGNNETNDGLTYNEKMIIISWQKFSEGHLIRNDGENIFFFQLGMALTQTVRNGYYFDQHFASYLDVWFSVFEKESNNNIYTNQFVGANSSNDYVFSRMIEAFFENPKDLKKAFPNSFAHLCLLLNQNPLAPSNDYVYDYKQFDNEHLKVELPRKVTRMYQYNALHWSYNLPIFTFIAAIVFCLYLMQYIIINYLEVLGILFIGSVIAVLTTYKMVKSRKMYSNILVYWLICFTGFVPLGFFFSAVFSYFINFSPQISTHTIHNIEVTYTYSGRGNARRTKTAESYTFNFTDGFLANYPSVRTIYASEYWNANLFKPDAQVSLAVSRGITGFNVITKKEILENEYSRY
jgi:Mlc titration factor MtfA (ptsG expression regulator)/predicted membrane protein